MANQTTLRQRSEWVRGLRINEDTYSTMRFCPAPPNTGIAFDRMDISNGTLVQCHVENLMAGYRWTSLEQAGVWVRNVEHVLAAMAGMGVDNAIVQITSEWIPTLESGSCRGFCKALLDAGIEEQDTPRKLLRLTKPIYFETALDIPNSQIKVTSPHWKRKIIGVPSDTFSISYIFHVPFLYEMGIGFAEYDAGIHSFAEDVGAARTYFLRIEEKRLKQRLSQAQKDFIVLTENSSQSLIDEVTRHKVMDFIGDMAVLGRPLVGRFVAFRTGHRFHHELARKLLREGYLEEVEV